MATPASRARGSASPDLAAVLAQEGHRVAAVIVEPILQAAAGMVLHPPSFLADVRAQTDAHDIPLIVDEVMTGFGRTGRFFASEHAGIEPDLMCVSKALTAGYLPLSATLASDSIYEAFLSEDRGRTFFHGHSFTGNPLACAIGLESLALFDEEDRLGRVAALEGSFGGWLERLERLPAVTATRHIGGMAALELSPAGSGGYLDDLGPRLSAAFLQRNVLLRPLGNVLYVLPPYVITDDEVDHVFGVIETVVGSL